MGFVNSQISHLKNIYWLSELVTGTPFIHTLIPICYRLTLLLQFHVIKNDMFRLSLSSLNWYVFVDLLVSLQDNKIVNRFSITTTLHVAEQVNNIENNTIFRTECALSTRSFNNHKTSDTESETIWLASGEARWAMRPIWPSRGEKIQNFVSVFYLNRYTVNGAGW